MFKSFFMISSSSRNEIFVWNILNTFWWLVGGSKHLSNLLLFQLFISFVKCNSGSFSFTVNRLRPSLAFIYQQSCRWFLKRLQNVKTYMKSIYNTFFSYLSRHDFWQCNETLLVIFCSQNVLKYFNPWKSVIFSHRFNNVVDQYWFSKRLHFQSIIVSESKSIFIKRFSRLWSYETLHILHTLVFIKAFQMKLINKSQGSNSMNQIVQ